MKVLLASSLFLFPLLVFSQSKEDTITFTKGQEKKTFKVRYYQFKEEAFSKISPMQFLELLRKGKSNGDMYIEFYAKAPKEWIKPDDLKKLINLIDSKEECIGVITPLTSSMPYTYVNSTVGCQATHLIDLYRKGFYYSNQNCYEAGIKEIKDWWREFSLKQ